MKKLVLASVSIIFLSIYVASSSGPLMEKLVRFRNNSCAMIQPPRHRYGGLYGLCFLPGYKSAIWEEKPVVQIKPCRMPRKTDIYAMCDSYIYGFLRSDTVFCGARSYTFKRWGLDPNLEVELDPSAVNVLLLERVERAITITPLDSYLQGIRFVKKHRGILNPAKDPGKKHGSVFSVLYDRVREAHEFLMNTNIAQNLEFNIFGFDLFTPLRETKALMNYKIFGHLNDMVTIIPGCPYLFLTETIDPKHVRSAFRPIGDAEIDTLVSNLNTVYRYYRDHGFDEVIYSIPPNPVSMLCPGYGKYNNVVRRIQNHPGLIMPMVDLIGRFDTCTCPVYFRSDSHWNYNGFNIWVNEVNKYLVNVTKNHGQN